MRKILNRLKQISPKNVPLSFLLLIGILVLYTLLIGPTINRLGISWDEDVDLRITRSYSDPMGFLFGLYLDLSQTRLPMFVVAVVFRLFDQNDLITARWVSVLAGALTIIGIYVYGKERFSSKVGLIAAGLLSFSPFFLSFARLAFTEADIYLACTFTWLLVTAGRFQDRPTIGRAAAAGIMLGLSISSKATFLVIIPALWLVFTLHKFLGVNNIRLHSDGSNSLVPSSTVLFWSAWSVLTLVVGFVLQRWIVFEDLNQTIRQFISIYIMVCLSWFIVFIWVIRHRHQTSQIAALAAFLIGFGLLTFAIFPPENLNNSGIIPSLLTRAESEMSFNPAYMGELLALYLLSIIFKSTPALGIGLIAGIIASLLQWRRKELFLPLVLGLSYFSGLLLLPLGQTFYIVPLLPIIALLAAYQFTHLLSKHRRTAFVLATVIGLWWGVEMIQCYPDYNLNGYQWLGTRPLFGRSSIGYRSVVHTTTDGVQQAVEWLNANAGPNQSAVLYVNSWHIVQSTAPDPVYKLIKGMDNPDTSNPDFVVLHINAALSEGYDQTDPEIPIFQYPFDINTLLENYEQVFTVSRAFGIEMANIWQRK
jgi:4-amino-4-deoxy-L-arabinose transferase-like glycosyltransferase